ncbi:MAG: sugar O-acetyltransferase [Muribaculaceae bacterium]|jgi:acetyltransferase-like isoleucine patch superfamily enzyme|nr:sugar O-acetyltransferase [Muribaculaceae bacterium]
MNSLELMRGGMWHHGIVPEIGVPLAETEELCYELNALPPSRKTERETILRRLLGKVGERFIIHSPFRCDFGKQISIGENFIGNFNLTILDEGPVTIGDNVFIGPNVSIYTIVHALDASQRNDGVMRSRPVTIGNNVWLGGNVVVLPGVTIGDNAVIGSGSVVTKDVPPSVLAVGNPCRVLRPITEADRIPVGEIILPK